MGSPLVGLPARLSERPPRLAGGRHEGREAFQKAQEVVHRAGKARPGLPSGGHEAWGVRQEAQEVGPRESDRNPRRSAKARASLARTNEQRPRAKARAIKARRAKRRSDSWFLMKQSTTTKY